MWKKIYLFLKKQGFDVYSPSQHSGICENPYIVIRNAGQMDKDTHSTAIYDFLVYFPNGKYSQIEEYRNKLVDVLSTLNFIRKTGFETPVIYEDEIKAYSFSIEYIIMKA